ncbi:DUF4827 family protein [Massilibacteroides sp.]|uniref:DUF4827 family protein n=1 Tax=Massilibacteroides sp. TaxID=2034766 RepID=UPI002607E58F|nr:DUF4827 family protein [Massilibacteroides sp.]MDD4514359.1 DUF4827 family protein [Massilibacteroides sp.]
MKKGFGVLVMVVAAVFVVSSCSKSQRTYTEMLKDERKAIQRLMDSLDIKVIDDYPTNGVFAENEFYKTETGLYINVIDSGNGNRAVLNQTSVLTRFEFDYISAVSKTYYTIDGFENTFFPLVFTYGGSLTSGDYYLSDYFSSGMVEPLQYVGDSSYVKLIIPFKIGSQTQQTGGDPIFCKKLRYIFEK